MLKPLIVNSTHFTKKIKSEALIKDFADLNALIKDPSANAKAIYTYNGLPTQIVAYKDKWEVRQLRRDIKQVIAYNASLQQWKLFTNNDIHLKNATRGGVSHRSDEFQATLTGGTYIL